MLVQDIIDLAKLRLNNISISKNVDALIKIIHLGISDLYNKFNLSIKSETIRTNSNLAVYTLREKDVLLLLSLYNRRGKELLQSDVINSEYWDYKIVNYKSFLLNHPKDDIIYAVYKASINPLNNVEDEIDLPDAMIEALLLYMAYMINSTITSITSINGRGGISESDVMYQRYLAACKQLDMQGYKIPLNAESLAIKVKGFV